MYRVYILLLCIMFCSAEQKGTQALTQASAQTIQTTAKPTDSREDKEVHIDESAVFTLHKDDVDFMMYGDAYVLLPTSAALKDFLNQEVWSSDMRTLRSAKSITQIHNHNEEILFYYSSKRGSNLYDEIAPMSFKLTPRAYKDTSKNPPQTYNIYIIDNFDEALLYSPCHITKSRAFVHDRERSEMLLDLNTNINPKLQSQEQMEIFLKCYTHQSS